MIKAICFDLDGVYFTSRGMEEFVKSLMNLGAEEGSVKFVIFKSDEMKSFKKGQITEQTFWNYVNSSLNLSLSVQEYSELLGKGYEINSEVDSYVKEIRSKGYKTCICTNNFETRIQTLESRFNFLSNFDVQVISYKVGVLKPDKAIFEELIKQSGVNASEIVYSDDNSDKLQGAIDLGIQAFVYVNFEQFRNKLVKLGVMQYEYTANN